ncbi:MAG TPA: DUF4439 domain-containing protein [Pedococcus sp.]|nr:DUF4439 domain-containing protein [Pedococcus sp.]
MSRADRPIAPRPERRAVLAAGLGAACAVTLGACGIRFGDRAPRPPAVPARTPIPGEAFLLALVHSSAQLSRQAAAVGGARTGVPAQLASLHAQQVSVLEAELLRLGVPQSLITSARSTGPTPSGSTTATAKPVSPGGAVSTSPADLAAAEAADATSTAFPLLARVDAPARPLAAALTAQRWAAANLLGTPRPLTAPAWKAAALASSFLDSTRAAIYGLQVVAAQSSPGAQATLARVTLAGLQARAQLQEGLAGASAGPSPLGYPLPFPVTTPAAAQLLAVHVLTELRATNARDLGAAADAAGPLESAVGWLADTEVLAARWGVRLSAFPGLK